MKRDKYNFPYYIHPPKEFQQTNNIFDFVTINPDEFDLHIPRIGLKYLIYNRQMQVYELYEITPYTIDTQILPFLKQGDVYLLSS